MTMSPRQSFYHEYFRLIYIWDSDLITPITTQKLMFFLINQVYTEDTFAQSLLQKCKSQLLAGKKKWCCLFLLSYNQKINIK